MSGAASTLKTPSPSPSQLSKNVTGKIAGDFPSSLVIGGYERVGAGYISSPERETEATWERTAMSP